MVNLRVTVDFTPVRVVGFVVIDVFLKCLGLLVLGLRLVDRLRLLEDNSLNTLQKLENCSWAVGDELKVNVPYHMHNSYRGCRQPASACPRSC